AVAAAGVAAASALVWRLRRAWPIAVAAWAAYLILLAPIAGLTPTGLQATADRYMYLPNVVLALVAGAAAAHWITPRGLLDRANAGVLATAAGVLLACGVLTARQAQFWRSSTVLWSRAIALDPRNDVAAYNLAVAYAGEKNDAAAIEWYERTLALVPDHDLARRNLAVL